MHTNPKNSIGHVTTLCPYSFPRRHFWTSHIHPQLPDVVSCLTTWKHTGYASHSCINIPFCTILNGKHTLFTSTLHFGWYYSISIPDGYRPYGWVRPYGAGHGKINIIKFPIWTYKNNVLTLSSKKINTVGHAGKHYENYDNFKGIIQAAQAS